MGMFEIEEQHLACQVQNIFKNKRLTEIEIEQLQKEIEKDKIVSDDTVLEMSCGESSGTKTVREQCCDLEDYPGDAAEDHIENPIHQCLIKIMHEGSKEIYHPYEGRDITLLSKHVNEVNEMLKCIPVRNLSELKYVARASASLVCEKVGIKIDHTINKKEPFWKQRIEKDIAILRNDLSRADDWFKGQWKKAVSS